MRLLFRTSDDLALQVVLVDEAGFDVSVSEFWVSSPDNTYRVYCSQSEADSIMEQLCTFGYCRASSSMLFRSDD